MARDTQRRLELILHTPFVRPGQKARITVQGRNLPTTTVQVTASDTIQTDGPMHCHLGSGSFLTALEWKIVSVQPGKKGIMEFYVTAGELHQLAHCQVRPSAP